MLATSNSHLTVRAASPLQSPTGVIGPGIGPVGLMPKNCRDFTSSCGVPSIELWCTMHGAELFFLSDVCCSACELEYREADNPDPDDAGNINKEALK
jgi:hypothetical protein